MDVQAEAKPRQLSISQLSQVTGTRLGVSPWLRVDQERIDAFGEVTGDRQWIHCDPDRARRESPYGATIAHGFLILSLAPRFAHQVFEVAGAALTVNYGLDRVRFLAPVPAGAQLRMAVEVEQATPKERGVLCRFRYEFETDAHDGPACVAQPLALFVPVQDGNR